MDWTPDEHGVTKVDLRKAIDHMSKLYTLRKKHAIYGSGDRLFGGVMQGKQGEKGIQKEVGAARIEEGGIGYTVQFNQIERS